MRVALGAINNYAEICYDEARPHINCNGSKKIERGRNTVLEELLNDVDVNVSRTSMTKAPRQDV